MTTPRPITTAAVTDVAASPGGVLESCEDRGGDGGYTAVGGQERASEPAASLGHELRRLAAVSGQTLAAKYSLLGTSLVSVVRGLRGTWPARQRRSSLLISFQT
ncbi:MAG: hypothetical protein ACRDSH_05340 [Pseudonocardiaceae bacterium]